MMELALWFVGGAALGLALGWTSSRLPTGRRRW
jgi:hypothetical protein